MIRPRPIMEEKVSTINEPGSKSHFLQDKNSANEGSEKRGGGESLCSPFPPRGPQAGKLEKEGENGNKMRSLCF